MLKLFKYHYVTLIFLKMEHYTFKSTLLLPLPEFAGKDFKWIDTIHGNYANGNTESIDVLVFNVQNKDEIKPMMEEELKRLQTLADPKEIDTHNMAYLEKLIGEMEDGCYEHAAPEELLNAIFRASGKRFSDREVIYLSGISGISK